MTYLACIDLTPWQIEKLSDIAVVTEVKSCMDNDGKLHYAYVVSVNKNDVDKILEITKQENIFLVRE